MQLYSCSLQVPRHLAGGRCFNTVHEHLRLDLGPRRRRPPLCPAGTVLPRRVPGYRPHGRHRPCHARRGVRAGVNRYISDVWLSLLFDLAHVPSPFAPSSTPTSPITSSPLHVPSSLSRQDKYIVT